MSLPSRLNSMAPGNRITRIDLDGAGSSSASLSSPNGSQSSPRPKRKMTPYSLDSQEHLVELGQV